MAEQYTPNLGHEPAEDARRDCVHVALAPVVAGQHLARGMRVALNAAGEAIYSKDHAIGIVDPFRDCDVMKGERFWLLLLPGTITGLRHVWLHPAFATKMPKLEERYAAEKYMRTFCERYGADYDDLLAKVAANDGYCFGDDEGPYIARNDDEFWKHITVLLGSEPDREQSFRCAC